MPPFCLINICSIGIDVPHRAVCIVLTSACRWQSTDRFLLKTCWEGKENIPRKSKEPSKLFHKQDSFFERACRVFVLSRNFSPPGPLQTTSLFPELWFLTKRAQPSAGHPSHWSSLNLHFFIFDKSSSPCRL